MDSAYLFEKFVALLFVHQWLTPTFHFYPCQLRTNVRARCNNYHLGCAGSDAETAFRELISPDDSKRYFSIVHVFHFHSYLNIYLTLIFPFYFY